jgi:hypothetical protein
MLIIGAVNMDEVELQGRQVTLPTPNNGRRGKGMVSN